MERKIRLNPPTLLLNEGFPHEPGCSVIREWEVDRAVEKLLEVFFRPVMRLTRTPNQSNTSLIINPLVPPLSKSLLDSLRIAQVILP